MSHAPEGGGGNFEQDHEVEIASVACKVETTKLGYLPFDPGEMPTINWRTTGGQVSQSSRYSRGDRSPDISKKPTGSSSIPTP